MNQQLKNQIYLRFAEDWEKSTSQFGVCVKIFDYLLSRPFEQLRHLTVGSLQVAIGEYHSDIDILRIIQYLCGDRTGVLSLHFEFLDENDEYYTLNNEDVKNAKIIGKLVHPRTGEYVENFEDKVLMYFTPTSLIKNIQD
jgi:uncharacterized beta-barrel protein YwiB (DUF1934 family)